MKKAILILMLSANGAFGQAQNDTEVIINHAELNGRVSIKGEIATFLGNRGFSTQENIESRKGDIVKVYWRGSGTTRCYNLKLKSVVSFIKGKSIKPARHSHCKLNNFFCRIKSI